MGKRITLLDGGSIQADLALKRRRLEQLAEDILELSRTWKPSPSDVVVPEQTLVRKAKEIIRESQNAVEHLQEKSNQAVEATVLHTLLRFGALQAMPSSGSINLQELAARTGMKPALLRRTLRLAVGDGLVRSRDNENYSHSELSYDYVTSNAATLAPFYYDYTMAFTCLPEFIDSKGTDVDMNAEDAHLHCPFVFRLGREGTSHFDYIEKRPEIVTGFQCMMVMLAHLKPFMGFYDYGKLATYDASRDVFVDIAGGDGFLISEILREYPNIPAHKCVLQERAAVIDVASRNSNLTEGVRKDVYDFFDPQPVKGARAYHIRNITHAWSDKSVLKILGNIVDAMVADSKLLIADSIMPESGASGMGAWVDLAMLGVGGRERTEQEFRELIDAVGLKVDGIYHQDGMIHGIIETSLK